MDIPYTRIEPQWEKNGLVFLIGGGTSLENFDWSPIQSHHVIGCNDAYTLGDWVDVCIFGDKDWYYKHSAEKQFQDFPGMKVGCLTWNEDVLSYLRNGTMTRDKITLVERRPEGWCRKNRIAFNRSTGAAAINLAVQLGAKKIVLLGYDMKLGGTKNHPQANWHPNSLDTPNPEDYVGYAEKFQWVKWSIDHEYKGDVEVWNAGPDSDLECFPRVELENVL